MFNSLAFGYGIHGINRKPGAAIGKLNLWGWLRGSFMEEIECSPCIKMGRFSAEDFARWE